MHSGVSTILFIVLGLIFVLAQFSRKKKATQTAESDEPVSPPKESDSPLSSLWNEFWDAPEESTPPKTSPAKPVSTPAKPVPPPAGPAEPADPALEPLNQHTDNHTSEGHKLEQPTPENNHFDLKSAVIYAALLERKYE